MALEERTTYIEDDWGDNNLSGRSGAEEGYFLHPSDSLISGDVEPGDALKSVYRPEWLLNTSDPYVQNSELRVDSLSGGSTGVRTPTKAITGEWVMDFRYRTLGSGNDGIFYFMWGDNNGESNKNDAWRWFAQDDANQYYRISKYEGGSITHVIDTTWAPDTNWHTGRSTRDSYGGWELFLDGSSQGTATDEYIPPREATEIAFNDAGGGSEWAVNTYEVK